MGQGRVLISASNCLEFVHKTASLVKPAISVCLLNHRLCLQWEQKVTYLPCPRCYVLNVSQASIKMEKCGGLRSQQSHGKMHPALLLEGQGDEMQMSVLTLAAMAMGLTT